MNCVYKYQFQIQDKFEIDMPIASDILKVEMQNGTPCMWALVMPGGPLQKRKFLIYGTGHELGSLLNKKWVATFQQEQFVWHLFEQLV